MPFRLRRRHRLHKQTNRRGCKCVADPSSSTLPLALAEPGSTVRICCLEGNGHIIRRLSEMGFVPGTEVEVLRRAPLADPVEYRLQGYLVSLRREEAALVIVRQSDDELTP